MRHSMKTSFVALSAALFAAQPAVAASPVWTRVLEKLGIHETATDFFRLRESAGTKNLGFVDVRFDNVTGQVQREAALATSDLGRTGMIEQLVTRGDHDQVRGLEVVSLPFEPVGRNFEVIASKIDIQSGHALGEHEVSLTRNVTDPGGEVVQTIEKYEPRTDASGQVWSVRHSFRSGTGHDFYVLTESFPRSVSVEMALPKGYFGGIGPLRAAADFKSNAALPANETGFILSHQVDLKSKQLIVTTSSGNQYVYDLVLTQDKGRGTPVTYMFESRIRETRKISAAALDAYRGSIVDLGRSSARGVGAGRGITIEGEPIDKVGN